MHSFRRKTSNWCRKGQLPLLQRRNLPGDRSNREPLGKHWVLAEQLATMKAKYITSEWYPFYRVYVHESESAQPILLPTTTSGVPVVTVEGAELLGITADKLVMACRRGALWRGREVRKTEIREGSSSLT